MTEIDPSKLTERGRREFDTYRNLGLSEAAAWHAATEGLDAVDGDRFDERSGRFERLGMSEATAREAARGGHVSDDQAREFLESIDTGGPVSPTGKPRPKTGSATRRKVYPPAVLSEEFLEGLKVSVREAVVEGLKGELAESDFSSPSILPGRESRFT